MSRSQFPRESGARGAFVRQASAFRRHVSAAAGAEFPAEAGRYHLYVSLACPWAHRTIIFRKLKQLEGAISLTVVDPLRDERGWRFSKTEPDTVNGFQFLSEAYRITDPAFDGRVTVPVLWDKTRRTIVSNESSEIIRMLNREFDAWGDAAVDFYPAELRTEIDAINDEVYANVNDGVYRAGFAATQEAYDEAFDALFATLDRLDERLARQRYLAGDAITEADWRLFTTLVRFDSVYFVHFKCNLRRIADYPHLWPYTRELFQQPGVAETVRFDHIKPHYFVTHDALNPSGIVPKGPRIDFAEPHGRG